MVGAAGRGTHRQLVLVVVLLCVSVTAAAFGFLIYRLVVTAWPPLALLDTTVLDAAEAHVSERPWLVISYQAVSRVTVPIVYQALAVSVAVLLLWRRPATVRNDRERFLPALRAGGRYVRHEPVIRTMLLRFVTFVFPAGAVWALLPLIASRQLSAGAGGYGLLFSALGVGAVVGALGLGAIKQHLTSNSILAVAAALFGLALAGLAFTSSMWVAIPLLALCGFGWSSSVATVTSELQLFLPGWVRARGLGVLLMVFLGTQAVAAPLWGLAVQQFGIPAALLLAAAMLGVSTALVGVLPVPDSYQFDRSPLAYWDTPRFTLAPEPTTPVVVSIRYQVDHARQAAFLAAMQSMRRSRLRSGATRWEIYRVGEDPRVFIEQFEVATWEEHQRQHDGRLTLEDKAIEDATFAHIVGRPHPEHLLPARAVTPTPPDA